MAWKNIKLARVELSNFKRFYGRHVIDLLPDPSGRKPIILIGGDNGRGKTSIHEAINYALFEDDDLPGINTRPNYLKAVSDRLNRRALDEGLTDYWVAVELLASDGSADRQFRIERRWEALLRDRTVATSALEILENGRRVDWVEDNPAAVQDFVRSILPPRIAPFFFFDGERIQQFADETDHEKGMVEAIEDILHINVYKQLREDLKKYVVDYLEQNEIKKSAADDFFKIQEDLERIQEDLDKNRDREADVKREIEELRAQRKRAEDELRRIASPHASERGELLMERERIEKELEQAKNEVRRGFEPLPLLLAGGLCNELVKTLQEEQRRLTTAEGLRELRQKSNTIEHKVFVSPDPPPGSDVALSPAQRTFYIQAYRKAVEEVFDLAPNVECRAKLHDIGDTERARILNRLGVVAQQANLLREAINQRERLSAELREIETKLQSTSDDPHIGQLIRDKQTIDEKLGRLDSELNTVSAEIQRLEADMAVRQRQIEDRQRSRAATTEAKKAVKLAQEARRVLDAFIRRLAPEKLQELRERFREMYGRLQKPEDPVRSIDIDRDTWQVILLDDKNRPLERRVFSAGMKEMYALSLLWALARASGRELPIVIDTPVGRLDTTNRRALFEKYLPNAGHQVVVLSTDTEVDVEWAKRLAPYVSKQYRLDYDASTDSIVIRPGYFF